MVDFLVFIVFWLAFVAWFLAKPSPYSRLALVMPIGAVLVLYGVLGQPFVPASYHASLRAAQLQQWQMPADLLPRIDQLAARLKEQPDDVEGWRMLGQSYYVSGQLNRARLTYERARQIFPNDLALLSLQADLLLQLRDENGYEIFHQLLARTTEQDQLMALIQRTIELEALREARDAIRRLQELYPENARPRTFLEDSTKSLQSP